MLIYSGRNLDIQHYCISNIYSKDYLLTAATCQNLLLQLDFFISQFLRDETAVISNHFSFAALSYSFCSSLRSTVVWLVSDFFCIQSQPKQQKYPLFSVQVHLHLVTVQLWMCPVLSWDVFQGFSVFCSFKSVCYYSTLHLMTIKPEMKT